MTGPNSYYENIAILSMQLEVCVCPAKGRAGEMSADECVARCDGTFVEPAESDETTILLIVFGTVVGVIIFAAAYYAVRMLMRRAREVRRSLREREAELDLVMKFDADIKATIGSAKETVMGVPKMGTEALAKLTAALAGGASAG